MSLRARSFNKFLDKPVSYSNLTEFERSCLWSSPRLKDWRETPADWFDPTQSEAYTNQVSRLSSEFRDRHMVKLLTEAVKNGARVFAVVGFSHVVMQERALKAALSGAQ